MKVEKVSKCSKCCEQVYKDTYSSSCHNCTIMNSKYLACVVFCVLVVFGSTN
ncbi:unnamed protein product, partial [Trichobilharzia szidati]